MNRAGLLFLGWIGETKDAGIFSLAFNIAFLVAIPRTALNTLFAPAISRLFDRKDHAQLQELVTKSTILSLGAAVFIAIGLLFSAEFLFFRRQFYRRRAGVAGLVDRPGDYSRNRVAICNHDHDG